jgi:hypothetical protein
MGHCRSELKPYVRSNNPSSKERANVYRCSSEENIIPESADDAAGTKSPRTPSARENNHSDVNESLKGV